MAANALFRQACAMFVLIDIDLKCMKFKQGKLLTFPFWSICRASAKPV